jgi:tetratricopeptide (TPR) repeat protein
MNQNQNDQNQPQPEGTPKEEVPRDFLRAIESYAEAVNAEKHDEAAEAALKALIIAAEQAMAHPTPEVELAEQADRCLRAADWAGAEAAYRKILRIQQETGNPGQVAKPRMDLSQLLRLIGRLDEAGELSRAATESARKSGLYPLIAMALRNEVSCALAHGRTDDALAAACEALRVIEPGKIADLMRAQAHTDRAECLLANGQADVAERDLTASWEILESRAPSRIGLGPVAALAKWCEVAAQFSIRKGNCEEALRCLEKAVGHRREGFNRSGDPSPHAFAALARTFEMLAEVSKYAGDQPGQEHALAEARAIWNRIHLPGSRPNLQT